MAESQILSVIRCWAAVAWADGILAEAEAEGLRKLIGGADLTDDERGAAARFLEGRTEPPRDLGALSAEARRGIYRAACRMAVVDHLFSANERSMLDRLQTLLAVPKDVAVEIEADVPGLM